MRHNTFLLFLLRLNFFFAIFVVWLGCDQIEVHSIFAAVLCHRNLIPLLLCAF